MKRNSRNIILIVISIGIWVLVLQNAGIIPTSQNVYVNGGYVDAKIDKTLNVDVENTVGVDIQAINGYNEVTTKEGRHSVFPFGYMLPVSDWDSPSFSSNYSY